ncbi:hypothetical protein EV426DRAFT_301847 [Tirmania nivea]|nr:hypothetical protein EV426DRAFT_301847 [Tirmania nivea]
MAFRLIILEKVTLPLRLVALLTNPSSHHIHITHHSIVIFNGRFSFYHSKWRTGFQLISFATLGISGSVSFFYSSFLGNSFREDSGRVGYWGLSFVISFVLFCVSVFCVLSGWLFVLCFFYCECCLLLCRGFRW